MSGQPSSAPSPSRSVEQPAGGSPRDTDKASSRPRWRIVLFLTALVLLSYLLRRPGLDYLMPHYMHRDGLVVVRMAELFRGGESPPELDRLYVAYPHLLPRLIALLPAPDAGVGTSLDLAQHLARASGSWTQARLVSVLFALLAIPATYLVARRFLDRFTSSLAAALVATSLLHVHISTLSQPHATAASFAVLAVLAALHLRRAPTVGRYVLAGLAAAAAAGALHTGLAVVPALVAAHLVRRKEGRRASYVWLLVALAIVGASVRALYPWYFVTYAAPEQTLSGELPARVDPQFPERWEGRGFRTIALTLWSYDPLLAVLVPLGVLFLLARAGRIRNALHSERGRDLFVVAAHAVPYFLVLGVYNGTYERFLLPILPAFACLAAFGVARALARFDADGAHSGRTAIGRVAAAALLLVPIALAVRLALVRTAPDTLERAAEWLAHRVEAADERIVVLPYYDLPLAHSDLACQINGRHPWTTAWVRYQVEDEHAPLPDPRFTVLVMPGGHPDARLALRRDPSGYFDAFRAGYVVLAVSDEDVTLGPVRGVLHAGAEPLLRLSPLAKDDGGEHNFNFRHGPQEFSDPYWLELLGTRSLGPTLELFRWRPQVPPKGG